MNHRQWKKQFMKQHGRNPEITEDRKRWNKVMSKKAFNDTLTEVIKRIEKIDWVDVGRRLREALEEMVMAVNRRITEAAEEMRRMMENGMKNCITCAYHAKDDRGMLCCNWDSDSCAEYIDPLGRCKYHLHQRDCEEKEEENDAGKT